MSDEVFQTFNSSGTLQLDAAYLPYNLAASGTVYESYPSTAGTYFYEITFTGASSNTVPLLFIRPLKSDGTVGTVWDSVGPNLPTCVGLVRQVRSGNSTTWYFENSSPPTKVSTDNPLQYWIFDVVSSSQLHGVGLELFDATGVCSFSATSQPLNIETTIQLPAPVKDLDNNGWYPYGYGPTYGPSGPSGTYKGPEWWYLNQTLTSKNYAIHVGLWRIGVYKGGYWEHVVEYFGVENTGLTATASRLGDYFAYGDGQNYAWQSSTITPQVLFIDIDKY